jgi:hypothetical protein
MAGITSVRREKPRLRLWLPRLLLSAPAALKSKDSCA